MARIPLKWLDLPDDEIELNINIIEGEDESVYPFIFPLNIKADCYHAEANLSREEMIALRDVIDQLLRVKT